MKTSPNLIKFVCEDCKSPVTRYGLLDHNPAANTRCIVCYFIYLEPDMDEAMKRELMEWGLAEAGHDEQIEQDMRQVIVDYHTKDDED